LAADRSKTKRKVPRWRGQRKVDDRPRPKNRIDWLMRLSIWQAAVEDFAAEIAGRNTKIITLCTHNAPPVCVINEFRAGICGREWHFHWCVLRTYDSILQKLNRLSLDRGFHIDLERSCWSNCNIEWWDGESHNTHSVKSWFISHLLRRNRMRDRFQSKAARQHILRSTSVLWAVSILMDRWGNWTSPNQGSSMERSLSHLVSTCLSLEVCV
jgi:hypothetical protein